MMPKKCRGEIRKNKPWVTIRIVDVCDKIRELRNEKYTSLVSRLKYQKANREVRKKM
ncbi:hypothetical protein DPMN_138942 [Dreissena polymorpha]|uniref:Uncharacterized protein n=1 Tax=Dreissena polymorpha TaxID=45954 RepID=A0A9D4G4U5_DREPO|nr:hypothetical protein DPMN_138942 [Dreissena polymorpha]